MNNQAFRELVNKQRNGSSAKSTKEIARQAVEEEFQELKRKRKLKGGGDGVGNGEFDGDFNMSDDENDGDHNQNNGKADDKVEDDEGNDRQKKKGRWKKKNKKNDNGEDQSSSSKNKYRDRAKERREGKNVDYQGTENISIPTDSGDPNAGDDGGAFGNIESAQYKNEMTKFLGGDEEFTHLVKGLDKSLADKVRREEMLKRTKGDDDFTKLRNGDDIDLDQVMEEAKATQSKIKKNAKVSKPTTTIGEKKSSSSSLVSSMALYIENVEEGNSILSQTGAPFISSVKGKASRTAGKNIHRSKLTFSLQENHHNLQQYGWEVPKVSVMSNSQYAAMVGDIDINDDIISRASYCTPLDSNLIQRIKSVLDSVNIKSQQKKKRQSGNSSLKKKKKSAQMAKQKDDEISVNKSSTQVEDDSDDDIYGNIGDYIPPTTTK